MFNKRKQQKRPIYYRITKTIFKTEELKKKYGNENITVYAKRKHKDSWSWVGIKTIDHVKKLLSNKQYQKFLKGETEFEIHKKNKL